MLYTNGKILLEVNQFENISPIFTSPVPSDVIGNYFVNTDIKKFNCLIDLSDLKYKCLFFPIIKNQAVAINLLHSE